jgi:uncharacterized membrane protein
MFQTHCYDAWLGGAARDSKFAMWSHLGGTFPAPLFLFLAGISVAIIADKFWRKGHSAIQVGRKIFFRGAEIFGLGLLFRVQEYVISWGWSPWSDLFRVDILNTIGLAIMLMGALCWAVLAVTRTTGGGVGPHKGLISAGIVSTTAIAALTPPLWTNWRPRFLPWELETYVNGVHNLGSPQPWLFPVFPWVGFAFAGLAVGFVLMSDFAHRRGGWIFLAAGVCGLALIYAAKLLDRQAWQIYPVYDYWHTSPAFFVTRVGLLLLLVPTAFAWCRWGLAQKLFSPMIQLGHTSLLVYWVHIEFVYGRFHILSPHSRTIMGASEGLLIIFLSMLALSLARTTWKTRAPQLVLWRKSASVAGSA